MYVRVPRRGKSDWLIRPNMKTVSLGLVAGALVLSGAQLWAAQPALANPILFVTQLPMPDEANAATVTNVIVSVASALGNHLADTAHAGRGGDLWIRYADGTLKNLTRAAGYGVTGAQHTNGIAVRQPALHWSGTKAVFSMVTGSPRFAGDAGPFYWQLYEITNFVNPGATPVVTRVSNQPTNYNNISPCYGTDGRILFTSDRARDGSSHLYPQLDEYNNIPTVTGLWSLDPGSGDLFMINHTPSGAFNPIIDSFGRVIFTRWDHLVQDRYATTDRLGTTTNGTFNYADESAGSAFDLNDRVETFPEPRNFDHTNLAALHITGQSFNFFFPWETTEEGKGEEMINHVGRHELVQSFVPNMTNDVNLSSHNIARRWNSNYIANFLQIVEDPAHGGTYFGVDAVDFGTHGAGQIVSLFGPPGTNPESMYLTYITPKSTSIPGGGGHLYRNPLPMSDGSLVAVHTAAVTMDTNQGTAAFPSSLYQFRLRSLVQSGATWTTNAFLTPGLTNAASYWNGNTLVTYTNQLWELDPVEVRARSVPVPASNQVASTEQQVFSEEGVDLTAFQAYLRTNNLALIVSRNVTHRDRADRQQPFNLRVAGTTNVTLGTNSGRIYDIEYLQLLQADQRRGLTLGGSTPTAGRRVLATPLHDTVAENVPVTNGPPGTVKLGDDGSLAAVVPARRAMTWQLMDTNSASVVKERFWITFQPGEIRTCASCHGLNTSDQAGNLTPTNRPQALRDLLQFWKLSHAPTNACQFSLSATNGSFVADGGSGSFVVSTSTNCNWTVSGAPSWVTITSSSSFTGNGTVTFDVAANPTVNPRSVVLAVAGGTFQVSQAGADLTPPVVTITSPSAGARLTNATTSFAGTASDAGGLALVEVQVGNGSFVAATGTTNWSAALTLPAGTNLVRVRAMDAAGNISVTNARTVYQVVLSPLSLATSGAGSVAGATNGERLEIGRTYALTAVPDPGALFSSWSGDVSGGSPRLSFVMATNLSLQANFIPNPFLASAGVFNGLFYETNVIRAASAGAFSLKVSASGTYSAVLRSGLKRYAGVGRFSPTGLATNDFPSRDQEAWHVRWAMGAPGSDQISGTVSNGVWASALAGDRATFHGLTNPAPWAGKYTVVVPGAAGQSTVPEGDGYGSALVLRNGMVSWAGALADGTRALQRTPLSKSGQWPLYAPLYAGQGAILGWVSFDTNQPTDDLSGLVDWLKPSVPGAVYYPAGFARQTTLSGSRYAAPMGATNRVLSFTNGLVVLTGGNLPASLTNTVILGATSAITNGGPLPLVLKFSLPTGLFRGRLLDTGAVNAVNFSGTILQKANHGSGWFLGTNKSGRVVLQAAP